jgi:hypothetical protein
MEAATTISTPTIICGNPLCAVSASVAAWETRTIPKLGQVTLCSACVVEVDKKRICGTCQEIYVPAKATPERTHTQSSSPLVSACRAHILHYERILRRFAYIFCAGVHRQAGLSAHAAVLACIFHADQCPIPRISYRRLFCVAHVVATSLTPTPIVKSKPRARLAIACVAM